MAFVKDFREFCLFLNEERTDYLIVGGYAVAFHGAPRATADIDILIRPEPEHVSRTLTVIQRFGFPTDNMTPEYVLTYSKILQLGHPPVQIHVMTTISGVTWEDAWDSRQAGEYGGVPVFFIGLSAFLANKAAAARPKDLADIEALRRKGTS
jgi:hypothetical protein